MPYDEPDSSPGTRLGANVTVREPRPAPQSERNDAKPPKSEPSKHGRDATDPVKPESQQDRETREKQQAAERARQRRRPVVLLVLLLLLGCAVAGGVWWWLANKDVTDTDDAYIDGRAITVAPKVSGYVTALNVTDNQRVRAGDVLLEIGPRDFIASRDQARGDLLAAQGQLDAARANLELAKITYPARLAAAEAQQRSAQATLTRAQADYRRQTSVSREATTQTNVDEATAGQRSALASVAQAEATVRENQPVEQQIAQVAGQVKQLEGQVARAEAALAQAELNISYTRVIAPQDGWVTKRNVERGNYVTAGSSVMSLVSPEVWVTANFKESQLNRMRPGQQVELSVDAYPGLKLKGHVDSVQLGSGSRFSAFPAENATGNYVKIVQRVPVKIIIDSGIDPNLPLPLGLSVVPTVRF